MTRRLGAGATQVGETATRRSRTARRRAAVSLLGGLLGAIGLAVAPGAAEPRHGGVEAGVRLPNGWKLTPAGTLVRLTGDMPLKISVAPDDRSALVVTAGFHDHAVDVVDLAGGKVRQHLPLGKAWAGLATTSGGRDVFVSGGGPSEKVDQELAKRGELEPLAPVIRASLAAPVLRLDWREGRLSPRDGLSIAGVKDADRFIAGLTVDRAGDLFVADLENDTIYKVRGSDGRVLATAKVGYRPYQLAISPDQTTLAVTNWGDRSVSLLNVADLKARGRVAVGIHPVDAAFGPDGRLYVANAGSNSVSVIIGGKVVETVLTSLKPGDKVGSTPDALAVSRDGRRLFVANADNNNVAVIDVSTPGRTIVEGFIPTGWYPSALAITPDGKSLVVGLAKGAGSRANIPQQMGPVGNDAITVNPDPKHPFDYIARVMTGYVEIIPVPGPKRLAAYSRQVRANVPDPHRDVTAAEKRQAQAAFRQIKHVVYIIRENRTYDQVLGDDPRGDGDPELTFFGRSITPNAHAIARQQALLDRYFVNGEVTEDGHEWANAAYATAFTQRATASTYGGRGEPDADERLVDSPAGHLWDAARKKGLSYFSYGESADFKASPDTAPIFQGDRGLEGHARQGWGAFMAVSDLDRAQMFVADLKAAEAKGVWPAYTVVWLPWDHTAGFRPGKLTPKAAVASNDLALGQVLEALSHSRFWDSMAVFVTEDDAQNGPDHVDAHRSVALVASPFVKPGVVDHTAYTMTGMVRTMELILGLPPMTQHDETATPMYRLFQARPSAWRFAALKPDQDLGARNPKDTPLAAASEALDWTTVDRADPDALNAILWAGLRPDTPRPAPVRSLFSLSGAVRSGGE